MTSQAPRSGRSPLSLLLPAAVAFAVAFVLVPSVVDVDLWGHVRFGGDIVRARAIPSADSYSFTADRAWVNHEWLAEVLMYGAYATAGAAGLTTLRLALVAVTLWFVFQCLTWSGVAGTRLVTTVALVAILTYTRTQHVRPQLFSIVLFAALVATLLRARQSRRSVWLVPAIVALWVNLHGGWIVGLGIAGVWIAMEMLKPGATSGHRLSLASVLIASFAATLANPYGPELWSFLWRTVGLGRPDISEWHPVLRTPPGVIAFWLVTLVAGAAAIVRLWHARTHTTEATIVVLLGVLSFRVSRLDAFFALAVFTLLAGAFRSAGPSFTGVQRRAIAAAVLCALAVRWQAVTRIDLASAEWLPEPDAVTFIRSQGLRGNMLTYFDWGEYAIWHLAPDVKVSMDGRRETVYGPDPIARHLSIYRGEVGGVSSVRRINPDYVWLPRRLEVVSELTSSGEWKVVFDGPQSTVLARRAIVTPTAPAAVAAPREFPGP